jgi:F-type H+-transporting ATPase subunit a
MPESFAFVHILNALFGGLIASALQGIGIKASEASQTAIEINRAFAMELIVAAILIVFFIIVRLTLSVEKPNPAQHVAEMIHGFTGEQADQIIGHGYERFQAFVTCIFLFVILNNLFGLVPGIETPTSNPSVPLGIAVLTFIYYNFHGVRVHGVIGYLKHFAGPIWWIAPLLFLIEIISHLARVMSLTIRLYANMLASDLVTLVFFSMMPIAIPSIFLGLHAGVSIIQAYVFMLLAMIYLSQAVEHEEAH